MMLNIFDLISETKKEAMKRDIKANTVILNSNIAVCKKIYQMSSYGMTVSEYPPMVLGLKAALSDELPDDIAIVVAHGHMNCIEEKISGLQIENEKLKKVIKIINEKDVNIFGLKTSKNYELYNLFVIEEDKLTEEEFNSVKEALKNEKV